MSKSLIIDPRTEDARNAPLEIWRDVGRGPGVYLTSEAYPDPEISGESASGEEGTRYEGRRKVGNRRIPLGVHVMEGDEPAGENLVPFTADSGSTAGLTATGATVGLSTEHSYHGEQSFSLTAAGGTASMALAPTPSGSRMSVARALRRYVGSIWLFSSPSASLRDVRCDIEFYTGANALLLTVAGQVVTENRDSFVRASVTAIAPEGAAKVRLQPYILVRDSDVNPTLPAGEVHYVDGWQIEERLPTMRDALTALGQTKLLAGYLRGTEEVFGRTSATTHGGVEEIHSPLIEGETGGLEMDGVGGHMHAADSVAAFPNSGPISLVAVIQRDTTSTDDAIFGSTQP